jgi:hypothetical protein
VIRHDNISAEKRRRNYGRKLPFRGPHPAHLQDHPPGLWELDRLGRPAPITSIPDSEWGRWGWVIPPKGFALRAGLDLAQADARLFLQAGPAAMPTVGRTLGQRLRADRETAAVGRHPVAVSDPLRSVWAAWIGDMREVSTWEVARRLRPWDFQVTRERHKRRTTVHMRFVQRYAERRVSAGRSILNRAGVLPWVLWPRGAVPNGWWADARYYDALKAWYEAYVVRFRPAILAAKEQVRLGASPLEAASTYTEVLRQQLGLESRSKSYGGLAGLDGPVDGSIRSRARESSIPFIIGLSLLPGATDLDVARGRPDDPDC